MKRDDVHRCWASGNDPWSVWVKPVLFAALDGSSDPASREREPRPLPPSPEWFKACVIDPLVEESARTSRDAHPYRSAVPQDAALVIDLPGAEGAMLGVHAAGLGFRPVPLYNALASTRAVVDVYPILDVLVDGAHRVASVPVGAPPAFLLDAERMGEQRNVRVGVLDNRSVCRPSDFPSADTLKAAGVRRVVLISNAPAFDLVRVLVGWQSAGLVFWRASPSVPGAAVPTVA
jgi:hypothetical protein